MFKALFDSAAAFVILVFAMVAPAGLLEAQQGVAAQEGVPVQAEAGSGEGVAVKAAPEEVVPAEAGPEQLTDEEIRQLLAQESNERFRQWRRRRGINPKKQCSDLNGVDGPTKPSYVYCDPADIPAEQVELYRENQRQQDSTFVNEPQIKF